MRRRNVRPQYVYCATDDVAVKIGASSNPQRRCVVLSQERGRPVRLLKVWHARFGGGFTLESHVHGLLGRRGSQGHEWHARPADEVIAIASAGIAKLTRIWRRRLPTVSRFTRQLVAQGIAMSARVS